MNIPELVTKYNSDKDVIRYCTDSLREINTNLQKAVVAENMGLVGQQQALLALTYGVLNQLDQKLNGNKSVNVL